MVKLENGVYVIGFDNGYQFGKTANTLFDNGVFAMVAIAKELKLDGIRREEIILAVGFPFSDLSI